MSPEGINGFKLNLRRYIFLVTLAPFFKVTGGQRMLRVVLSPLNLLHGYINLQRQITEAWKRTDHLLKGLIGLGQTKICV